MLRGALLAGTAFALMLPVALAGQGLEGEITNRSPTLASELGHCRSTWPNLGGWGDHFDVWEVRVRPGEDYIVTVAADEPVRVLVLSPDHYTDHAAYRRSRNIRFSGDDTPQFLLVTGVDPAEYGLSAGYSRGRSDIRLVRSPRRFRELIANVCGVVVGRTPARPAGGGRPPPFGGGSRPISSGMTMDLWAGLGTADYAAAEGNPGALALTVGLGYQAGINSWVASVIRVEAMLDEPMIFDESEGTQLWSASAWGARAFAGVNLAEILEVGYGFMGISASGENANFEETYGGAGMILQEAVHGSVLLSLGNLGLRGSAYTTTELLGLDLGGEGQISESVYRLELTFADDAFGAGVALRDFTYDPDAGRTISGSGTYLFLGIHLRPF